MLAINMVIALVLLLTLVHPPKPVVAASPA
jgi:hypothetical protein